MRALQSERLSIHLPFVLMRAEVGLSHRELRNSLRSVFAETTTPSMVRQEMGKLSLGSEKLLAVVLRLLASEQGAVRVGNLSQMVRFCQEQAPWFDLARMAGDILTQDQLVNEVRKSFPKQRDAQHIEFAAMVLAERYLEHLARITAVAPWPLFVVDGPSAIGKSSIVKILSQQLEAKGWPTVCVSLDILLKDESWRRQRINKIINGQIDARSYDESAFFDTAAIAGLFARINDFRGSGEESRILSVNNAFDSKTKTRGRKEYSLTKRTVIIIEGKYANLEQFQPFYGPGAFTSRLEKTAETVRDQYVKRGGRGFADQERLAWYDTFLKISFEQYAAQTAGFIRGVLNMEPNDELD